MLSVNVYEEKSIGGYPLDELVSLLQKSIRRGDTERAVRAAWELARTSDELEEHVWRRLLVISAEDIGSGNWMANVVVKSLYDSSRLIEGGHLSGDRRIMMVNAIRFLSSADKERVSCLYSDILKRLDTPITFPDYAYDRHTKKGKEMGRGFMHFLSEASVVEPDIMKEEEEELKKVLAGLLKEEEK